MKLIFTFKHVLLVPIVVLAISSSAWAVTYTFTTIDPGVTFTEARGINAAGQIVGRFFTTETEVHGFLRDSGGGFTTLDVNVPGARNTNANGINDAGQIVGSFNNATGDHGFLRDSAGFFTPVDVDVPGARNTEAFGINAAGQIVGRFNNTTGDHGFLRDSAGFFTPVDVDVPGGRATQAFGINAAGQIVGRFGNATGTHGFLRDSAGLFTTIDAPGATFTEAFGINAAGQIVGSFSNATGGHGFLRDSAGGFTTLDVNVPGARNTQAFGINAAGQIVGSFNNATGTQNHGFLATPGVLTPPSVATLAKLSADVYNPTAFGADGFNIIDTRVHNGFAANAYAKDNNVVIAIQGTVRPGQDFATGIKNLLADTSFLTGTPSIPLVSEILDAVAFLNQIAQSHPDSNITLTGHSLGGGIAQLLGNQATIRTVTFNAPGAAQLQNSLSNILQNINTANLRGSSPGAIENYRLYGDAISLAGIQIGSSITVDPPGTLPIATIDASPEVLFQTLHDINVLVGQIGMAGVRQRSGTFGGTRLVQGVNYFLPINLTTLAELLTWRFQVLSGIGFFLLDPPPGAGYELLGEPGSPFLRSIELPTLDGISQWNISFLIDGFWSADQVIPSLDEFMFGTDVNAVRFVPLDTNGLPTFNNSFFSFALSFAGTGEYSATLHTDPGSPSVPEPSTILLLGSGLAGLAVWRRKRQG